jgi:hypothetical protein
MNDIMHDLLNKIRVVSKIKEGQKLDVSNGLSVYNDGWISWMLRKWNRDNKDEGVKYLRDLYRKLQQSIETVIEASNHSNASSNHSNAASQKSLTTYVLINAAFELKASVRGLDNMCKTYANYPTTVAAFDGILKDYVIVTYSSLMEAIPEKKLTKELRESITYSGVVVYNGKDGMHIPAVSPALVAHDNNDGLP